MANKLSIVEHSKSVLAGSLVIALSLAAVDAAGECVIKQNISNQFEGSVSYRKNVEQNIYTMDGQVHCTVRYDALIGDTWHSTMGEYTARSIGPQEACNQAMRVGDESLLRSMASMSSVQETMFCSDEGNLKENTEIGTVGSLDQFRAHPKYPASFNYNGTKCRWIMDTEFSERKVLTFEGIVCKIGNSNKWTVIDKF